jgi:hypothetical protein
MDRVPGRADVVGLLARCVRSAVGGRVVGPRAQLPQDWTLGTGESLLGDHHYISRSI